MSYTTLKTAIDAALPTNGTNSITALDHRTILKQCVDDLASYDLKGVATPATNPPTYDGKAMYFTSEAGTYTNFNSIVVGASEFAILYNDGGGWAKYSISLPSGGGSGDMTKAVYDTGDNGIVDSAEKVDGIDVAGNDKFYGTNGSGTPGFYDLPGGGDMLKSTYDTDNDGIVDNAEKVDGVDAAGNLSYYGKDAGGAVGFHTLPPSGTGDMEKSTYDTNNNGIVDNAEKVDGIDVAGNDKFYGTNGSGTPGFYDLPGGGDMLKSTYDTDNDGIVDNAEKVDGVDAAGNLSYYGKDAGGTVGFHTLPPSGTGDMEKATYDTNNNGIVDNAEKVDGVDAASNSQYYGKNGAGSIGFHDLPAGGTDKSNNNILATGLFDPENITANWTQPSVDNGSTAIVKFTNGVGAFSYSGSWSLDWFHTIDGSEVFRAFTGNVNETNPHPRRTSACTYKGQYFRTYITWLDVNATDLEVKVTYFDHDTNQWGATVAWGTPQAGARDTHAAPAIHVTARGYILIAQEQLVGTLPSGNNNSPIHIRRSTNPEDISTWAAIAGSPLSDDMSYSNFGRLSDGTILLFHRDYTQWLACWKSTDDGATWLNFDGDAILTTAQDRIYNTGNANYWAYFDCIQLEDGICIHSRIRNTNITNSPYTVSHFLFTRDGETWGNWQWYAGGSGAWSKDVVTSGEITLAEMNTNLLFAGDVTVDSMLGWVSSVYVVEDKIVFGYTDGERDPATVINDYHIAVYDKDKTLLQDFSVITNNDDLAVTTCSLPFIMPINVNRGIYDVLINVDADDTSIYRTHDNGNSFYKVKDLTTVAGNADWAKGWANYDPIEDVFVYQGRQATPSIASQCYIRRGFMKK